MKPNTPILMLSLLIPVTPDTSPEQVINIIGQQVLEALNQIQIHQSTLEEAETDPEAVPQDEFNESVPRETFESYSDTTRDDLLAKLGYEAKE
jgi:hypothetical protein